ncbi:Leucine-rich repeat-containing protein [Operophtera brumata]|uniref:Leucine-rich repeat-containing protein n=1 Tax=Operophtera brumata TaxID=104452 RepID=A0A0L7LKZ7_OPEBR|nr:Leucine-rich repeat-containing protein [Operophtera brumata]
MNNAISNSHPSSASGSDEGVISVDLSRDVLEDTFAEMSDTPIPPDLIMTIVERFSEHIKYLDISHNKITNLDALESCPSLQYLCLMGNPAAPSYFNGGTFYEYLQYRLFVISQFPSLNHLDDRRVTGDQRTEAQRLYKRPLVERLVSPGGGGLAQLLHGSVTWSTLQGKLSYLWGKENKDEREGRNLLI